MRIATTHRSLSLAAALSLAACASPGPASTSPSAEAGASPADACIAKADAKHAKNPKEPETITVRHVLVKHTGSKSAPSNLTRTRGEACLRAEEALEKLKGGEDFTKLVGEYSDSPGVSNDGALGSVRRIDLDPAFADAAFELDPGQMSNVVETPFGFHVIVRTE
jgi:hypothetical protein